MISKMQNVTFVSKSKREFVNKSTGEKRVYYKGFFTQDDSEPLLISISEDVYDYLQKLRTYDLELELGEYKDNFVVKVVYASETDGAYVA